MIKEYYRLAKPGIIYGNLIPVIGGFALAAHVAGHFSIALLVGTVVGISFVMGSACVFNNYIDRDIDKAMERTKDRALVAGRISGRAAPIYATCLGVIGFAILILHTNILAAWVAFVGFFFYVFAYSMWSKRRTTYAAIVGSVSGAVPPVVGYAAVANRLDGGAFILFAILVLWQIPHFYAIAIRRAKEYQAAGVPIMPLVSGIRKAQISILLYIVAFTIVAPLLSVFGYLGYAYFIVALLLGLAWLALSLKGFWISERDEAANARWARAMFLFSLIVMVVLFATIVAAAIPWP